MRKVTWRNRNKMEISTGHREFDRQCTALGTGNHVGSAQYSGFIRAWETSENPVGDPCAPGAMQEFDLQHFRPLPEEVEEAIARHARDEDVILYQFSHLSKHYDHTGYRVPVVHGYVLTRAEGYELLEKFVTGPTKKSKGVIDVCAEYVANTREELGLKASDDAASAARPHPRLRPSSLATHRLGPALGRTRLAPA